MPSNLAADDPIFVNFRGYPFNHAYRWVHISRFGLVTDAADTAVISAVIDAESYRDGYIGAGADPKGTIHGPFRIECIGTADYSRVPAEAAAARFDRWAAAYGAVPAELAAVLDEQVHRRFAAADTIHVLRDLGDDAVCEYGRIHTEFNEFLTIDRRRGEVALIVAADD
ncbi:hypothetical protein [Nocardia sp. NPDC004415]